MTSSSLGDDDGAGLGDPFAEIFARIAVADAPAPPPEVQSVESSGDDDSTETDETPTNEKSDSDDDVVASGDIATIKTPEALLNTDDERVEVAESEVNDVAVIVENDSSDDSDQSSGSTEVELLETAPKTTLEETTETPFRADETPNEGVVEEAAAVLALPTNRRDRGEQDAEAVTPIPIQNEASDTEIQIAARKSQTEVDSQGDQRESSERAAPVAVETNDRVQRRRYSGGENSNQPQDESSSQGSSGSGSLSSETPNASSRGQESRSPLTGSSSGGIDVSSLTPISPSVSNSAPINALNTAVGASASSAKSAIAQSSSVSSAASATTKGGDATAPIDGSSNQPRSTSTPSAKSEVTGTDTLSAVQRAKMVQRVSRGFQQLGPNGGQIRMRLSPDELGSIQLQLKLQNGELSGTMLTQTEAASQALREQLPQLRSALENQGIRLDRMDIQTEAAANAQDADASGERFGDTSGQSGRGFEQRQQLADQRQRSSWSDVRATPKKSPTSAPENGDRSVNYVSAGAVDLRA